jgi:chromosome segregation ATPase
MRGEVGGMSTAEARVRYLNRVARKMDYSPTRDDVLVLLEVLEAAERSKVALVEKVKRLQDQIARAVMEPGQDRQKAMHAYAERAEKAEAEIAEWRASNGDLGARLNRAEYLLDEEQEENQRFRDGIEALADDFISNVDWSSGRSSYGDNAAWESAANALRALLAEDGA